MIAFVEFVNICNAISKAGDIADDTWAVVFRTGFLQLCIGIVFFVRFALLVSGPLKFGFVVHLTWLVGILLFFYYWIDQNHFWMTFDMGHVYSFQSADRLGGIGFIFALLSLLRFVMTSCVSLVLFRSDDFNTNN